MPTLARPEPEVFVESRTQHRRLEERNNLILQHADLAAHLARPFFRGALGPDDALGVALLALVEAVDDHDPEGRASLRTYVWDRITWALRDAAVKARSPVTVPRSTLSPVRKVQKALRQELEAEPTVEQITERLNADAPAGRRWSEHRVSSAIRAHVPAASWDDPVPGDEGDGDVTLADIVADPSTLDIEERILSRIDAERVGVEEDETRSGRRPPPAALAAGRPTRYPPRAPEEFEDILHAADVRKRAQEVVEALERADLTDVQRRIIQLRTEGAAEWSEVAEEVGVDPGYVGSLWRRALRTVRQELGVPDPADRTLQDRLAKRNGRRRSNGDGSRFLANRLVRAEREAAAERKRERARRGRAHSGLWDPAHGKRAARASVEALFPWRANGTRPEPEAEKRLPTPRMVAERRGGQTIWFRNPEAA